MKTYCIIACLILFSVHFSYSNSIWKKTNGPYGGLISSLTISKDGVIVAGADDCGVYISRDKGENWIKIKNARLLVQNLNMFSCHEFKK